MGLEPSFTKRAFVFQLLISLNLTATHDVGELLTLKGLKIISQRNLPKKK
jgi:hypothetical protein